MLCLIWIWLIFLIFTLYERVDVDIAELRNEKVKEKRPPIPSCSQEIKIENECPFGHHLPYPISLPKDFTRYHKSEK